MKLTLQVLVVVGLLTASIAARPASSAGDAYKPSLIVISRQSPADTDVGFTQFGAPATAEVDLWVPAGYRTNLAQPAGTQIGTLAASAQDRFAPPFARNEIVVADPTPYAKSPCDSAAHTAVWLATLKSATTTFSFPIFVRTQVGQPTELHWCLPKSAPPLGSISFDLTNGVFTHPASGTFRWDGRFQPYDQTTGTEIAGQQVSSLVTVRFPQVIALTASYSKSTHIYRLTVRATEDGKPAPGFMQVWRSVGDGPFMSNARFNPRPRRIGSGSETLIGHLSTTKAVRFKVHFTAAGRTLPCEQDLNGVPCVKAMTGAWERDSNVVTIRP